jgi:quercetin dioxygenase-like cupin family protein
MKTMRIAAAAVLMVTATVALLVVQAQQPGATRTELQRHDLSMPGREVIQVRVELAPGTVFPSHTHPGEEIIYVIEGTWAYEIAGKPVTARPGDVLFVPAGTANPDAGQVSAADTKVLPIPSSDRSLVAPLVSCLA